MIDPRKNPHPPHVNLRTANASCCVVFIGAPLAELLPPTGYMGKVIALFQRACWLETSDSRLFCIADHLFGEGPLTLGVNLPPGYNMDRLGIREGSLLVSEGPGLRFGDGLLLRTRGTTVWHPAPIGRRASEEEIRYRWEAVIAGMGPWAPGDGLAPLAACVAQLARGHLPGTASVGPVASLAMPHVAQLANSLIQADGYRIDQAVEGLVGLGPGLTPSGDDLLGGVMVALSAALTANTLHDQESPRRRPRFTASPALALLAERVTRCSTAKTTGISAALLEQSAKGTGGIAQHRLLHCLLAAESCAGFRRPARESTAVPPMQIGVEDREQCKPFLDAGLRRNDEDVTGTRAQAADHRNLVQTAFAVTRLGHTSGWDTLAGILLGVGLALRLHATGPGSTASSEYVGVRGPSSAGAWA